IYTGANIENLSFPQGWCAEPTAIGCMIMGGGKKIVEMAVIAEKLALCPPCGGCRQKISEFASADTKIYLCDEVGVQKTMTMDELLPLSFKTDVIG
ncbi:MAG: cytidine deaminase, partial [Allorhizobium sp.]